MIARKNADNERQNQHAAQQPECGYEQTPRNRGLRRSGDRVPEERRDRESWRSRFAHRYGRWRQICKTPRSLSLHCLCRIRRQRLGDDSKLHIPRIAKVSKRHQIKQPDTPGGSWIDTFESANAVAQRLKHLDHAFLGKESEMRFVEYTALLVTKLTANRDIKEIAKISNVWNGADDDSTRG